MRPDQKLPIYLQRDVVPAGQILADGCQRVLLNVPDAFVDVINRRVALPLAGGFVPANEEAERSDTGRQINR